MLDATSITRGSIDSRHKALRNTMYEITWCMHANAISGKGNINTWKPVLRNELLASPKIMIIDSI